MFRKVLTISLIFICLNNIVLSSEIPVKVISESIISTSGKELQEGDDINLVIAEDVYINSKLFIKKGEPVKGVITSLVDNGFTCQPASIYAENFKVKNINGKTVKLKGIVYKNGRNHSYFTQYIPDNTVFLNLFFFIRGGEAKIVPNKDSFILYLKDNAKRQANDDL